MNRVPVASSSLSCVGDDNGSQTLEIEFTGGRVYQHFDVPASVRRELLRASSPGSRFRRTSVPFIGSHEYGSAATDFCAPRPRRPGSGRRHPAGRRPELQGVTHPRSRLHWPPVRSERAGRTKDEDARLRHGRGA